MPQARPTISNSQRLHKDRRHKGRQQRATLSTGSTSTSNVHVEDTVPQLSQHQCCGVVEETIAQTREKRANRTKPQPWLIRKLMVFLTLGIMGYAGYVYVGRFCLSMIKQTPEAVGSRTIGVVLLTIFCVLYLWMILAYLKVTLTPPGYARDYSSRAPQPMLEFEPRRSLDYETEHMATQYPPDFENLKTSLEFDPTRTYRHHKPSYSSSQSHVANHARRPTPADPIAGPSYEDLVHRSNLLDGSLSLERAQRGEEREDLGRISSTEINEDDGGVGQGRLRTPSEPPFSIYLPDQSPAHEQREVAARAGREQGHAAKRSALGGAVGESLAMEAPSNPPRLTSAGMPVQPEAQDEGRSFLELLLSLCVTCCCGRNESKLAGRGNRDLVSPTRRRLSTKPVLHPAHRYCHRDEIVKPYRAHHCRQCGTCVLKFDHHCPWIGQCVGARNHKFFLNFCQSAGILTLYVFGTLVGLNVPAWVSTSSTTRLDPQIIVVGALAALFALFTSVLTCSHVLLILKGQTTVESMAIHSAKEQESSVLVQEFGWLAFRAQQDIKKQWNEEWGDLDTEGNIWWPGSRKQGWIDVMGANPFGWLLPIGRSRSDGLSYAVNPRFDEQGRLRRRAEWPAELR